MDINADPSGVAGPLLPLLAERLTEPTNRDWHRTYDCLGYGDVSRSGNGKVFSIVTGNPNYQCKESEEGPAHVAIFDIIKDRGFVQRCKIEVEYFGMIEDTSDAVVQFSAGGEFVSILNCEKLNDEGSWTVYDIRGSSAQELVGVGGFPSGCDGRAFFTPNNDLLFTFGDPEDIDKFVEKLKSSISNLPQRFTNRILLCPSFD